MAAPPIAVQLTKFEQLEILRTEVKEREEELKQNEKQIRSLLYEVERIRYLQTLHPLFQQLRAPAELQQLPQLQQQRELLADALRVLTGAITQLEAETAGMTPPPSTQRPAAPGAAGAAGARRRFDSFDDFRANRPAGDAGSAGGAAGGAKHF